MKVMPILGSVAFQRCPNTTVFDTKQHCLEDGQASGDAADGCSVVRAVGGDGWTKSIPALQHVSR